MFNNLLLSKNKDHRSLSSSIPFEIFWRGGDIRDDLMSRSLIQHKSNIRLIEYEWL